MYDDDDGDIDDDDDDDIDDDDNYINNIIWKASAYLIYAQSVGKLHIKCLLDKNCLYRHDYAKPPLAFNYSLSKIVFLAVITQSPLAFDYSSPRIAFYYAIPPLAFPGTFHNGFHKTASTRFQLSLIIQRTPLV